MSLREKDLKTSLLADKLNTSSLDAIFLLPAYVTKITILNYSKMNKMNECVVNDDTIKCL